MLLIFDYDDCYWRYLGSRQGDVCLILIYGYVDADDGDDEKREEEDKQWLTNADLLSVNGMHEMETRQTKGRKY